MFAKHRSQFSEAQRALESNDYIRAEEAFSKVIGGKSDAIEALLHRALTRLRLGKMEAALEDAQKVIELRPESSYGLMIKGEILNEMKQYETAYEALQKACELEKDNGRAFFALGRACAGLGKKHEAADYFEVALQFERDYVMAQALAEGFASRS